MTHTQAEPGQEQEPARRITHIVKRESGYVAGWFNQDQHDSGYVTRFADECNENVPADPAHIEVLDDSGWDDLLADHGHCADCGQPVHLTDLPPLPDPVWYHDAVLDMWQCPGHGPVRNADAEHAAAVAVGVAPVTYRVSPNGVTHLIPATGPCATCGQGRHEDWAEVDEDGSPVHDCPKNDFLADPALITFGLAKTLAAARTCAVCDREKVPA